MKKKKNKESQRKKKRGKKNEEEDAKKGADIGAMFGSVLFMDKLSMSGNKYQMIKKIYANKKNTYYLYPLHCFLSVFYEIIIYHFMQFLKGD